MGEGVKGEDTSPVVGLRALSISHKGHMLHVWFSSGFACGLRPTQMRKTYKCETGYGAQGSEMCVCFCCFWANLDRMAPAPNCAGQGQFLNSLLSSCVVRNSSPTPCAQQFNTQTQLRHSHTVLFQRPQIQTFTLSFDIAQHSPS